MLMVSEEKARLVSDKHVCHVSLSENTMKKLLSMGLLTLCALAASQQQAHAWVNAKFSVGLNWQLQSANNNWLWGFWKNGQVPGPEAFGQPAGGPGFYGPGGMGQPGTGSGQFPYFGGVPQANPPMPQASFQETPPPALFNQPQRQTALNYGMPNYYNPYQTVSYQNGYYYPNYYGAYPQSYDYASGYAPYYWYGGR
jgi:hypothetical protein